MEFILSWHIPFAHCQCGKCAIDRLTKSMHIICCKLFIIIAYVFFLLLIFYLGLQDISPIVSNLCVSRRVLQPILADAAAASVPKYLLTFLNGKVFDCRSIGYLLITQAKRRPTTHKQIWAAVVSVMHLWQGRLRYINAF